MWNRAAMAALVAVCLGSSCSPYVYKNEIHGFAGGVETLDQSYEAGLRAIADQRVAAYNALWLNNKPAVALSVGCESPGSAEPEPCGVINPFSSGNDSMAGPSEFERAAAAQRPHIRALADYAAALDAITRAEDREAFDNAAAALAQSVDALAGRVKPDAAAPSLGPLVGLFSYVAGTYLDQRRFVALRSAVREADPELVKLKQPFSLAFENMGKAKREYLVMEGQEVALRLGRTAGAAPTDQAYVANLRELERIAAATDVLALSEPQTVVDSMIAAHAELRQALDEARGQDKELIQAIKVFVEKAKAVQAAFVAGREPQAP